MKKNAILLFPMIIVIMGCSKFDLFEDKSPVSPTVRMLTAESYNDTTLLVAEITNEGSSPVYVCGFCYDTVSNGKPRLFDQQILMNGTDGKFGLYLTDLVPGINYNIVAFASNSEGYSYSNVMTCEASFPLPPVIPCDFPDNTIIDGGTWTVDDVEDEYVYSGYMVVAYYKFGLRLELTFYDKPENGIYTTCELSSLETDGNKVNLAINNSYFEGYVINNDGKVYVEHTDEATFYITFCELVYTFNSHDNQMMGRIKVE